MSGMLALAVVFCPPPVHFLEAVLVLSERPQLGSARFILGTLAEFSMFFCVLDLILGLGEARRAPFLLRGSKSAHVCASWCRQTPTRLRIMSPS